MKNLPLDDVVLRHSKFANFASRKDVSIEDVEYFIDMYSTILKFGALEFDMTNLFRISCCLTMIFHLKLSRKLQLLQSSKMARKKNISAWMSFGDS